MIDITILTKYSSQGASSRYRYFLYINQLLQRDINIEIDSFLDTSYLKKLYSSEKKSEFKILIAYIKRFFVILNSSENLIIEYEVFPYLPYFIEKLFLKNKKYILNFDDNIWDNYEHSKLLNKKLNQLVKNASGVIVANSFLEEKIKNINSNVIKIPTVIDLSTYQQEITLEKFNKFSLVWIGSPTTYKYIKSHSEVFQKLTEKIDYQLIIIASKSLESDSIEGVEMKFYDWSPEIEVEILKQSHVGIMPLDNDSFSQGKSAFKIIQYMAAGIPVVASSIGENNRVILNNETGYLVNNNNEWIEKIVEIYTNQEIYEKMAIKGKEHSYDFSIQKYFNIFYCFLQDSFDLR